LSQTPKPFRFRRWKWAGKLRAITGSSISADRLICEFGAIANDDLAHASPGEFLFFDNISMLARGVSPSTTSASATSTTSAFGAISKSASSTSGWRHRSADGSGAKPWRSRITETRHQGEPVAMVNDQAPAPGSKRACTETQDDD
jgi:hypothetical protein